MWIRVLLLWFTLFVGALVLGGVSLWLGSFVQDNVRTELVSQQISFPDEARLSDAERAIPGVVENAGLSLTTGNQAEIYAAYIGLHMAESAEETGYPGAAYATLGGIQRGLRAEVAAAEESGDEEALAEAQASLTAVTNLRNSNLTGSTLRGTLLSAYGWDNVATGVQTAGFVVIGLSVVFLLLFLFELQKGHLPVTQE